MNHHEEAIDEALLMRSPTTVFAYKHCSGEWRTTIHLPRATTYYSIASDGAAYLNTPEDSKPIRIRASNNGNFVQNSEGG